ncbi:DNA replication and repair protein RecF [Desulfuromonas sp. AOP6]|uniref:DNA replication/repair protein RecF n=1 Tax=Desulfuromonas sp. AOP6 TaxID=1566351 RepID=UPI00127E0A71|nr:DNA replication and repair protein RecF [Desulfuromonas sp. AOP6]BCA78216.1 DNA replication and repair protein RecF [Desulfuromonas sp. AOP6]
MILKNLNIKNFRNLHTLKLDFSEKFNFIYGKNGQGKTNIIEAIYLLANLKSFRVSKNSELITFHKNKASINSTVNFSNYNNIYNLIIENESKKIFINDKKPTNLNDYYGDLKVIVFNPDDINIIKGYPQQRRALLDRAIFLSDKNYLNKLIFFNKCLKQRNLILKNDTKNIDVYNEIFLKSSFDIYYERKKYINRIKPIFNKIYKEITNNNEDPNIIYNENDIKILMAKLEENIEKNIEKEKIYGMTLYGPHRDDPFFLLNDLLIKKYGSQGQQKSFMLAFKSAQVFDIKNETGFCPILLLDDMTSELDSDRRKYFYKFLFNHEGQVFLTGTDKNVFEDKVFMASKFFEVINGSIN